MNCDKFMQSIDAYFDGELDCQTSKEFEEHKLSCESCNLVYASYEDMLKSLKYLDQDEIPLPKGLHDSIMKSVNVVAKDKLTPDIIDITQHIETKDQIQQPEIKVVKDFKITTESYFTKRRVNTFVAGLLTLFIGTGAYTTYDRLQTPVTTEEPLITIDYDAIEKENSTTQETEKEIALFSTEGTGTDIPTEVANEPVADSVAISQGTTTTDEVLQNPDTPVSSETSTNITSQENVKVQSPSVQSAPQSAQATLQSAPVVQSRKLAPDENTELLISVNNSDSGLIEDYLDYLTTSPDIKISDIQSVGDEYHLTATSSNIDDFIFYAKSFSGYDKDALSLSYSDETLAKINELQEFKIKLFQN